MVVIAATMANDTLSPREHSSPEKSIRSRKTSTSLTKSPPPVKDKKSTGWLKAIVDSIFEPGINDALLLLMHGSFISLIGSLFWMIYLAGVSNHHVLICTVISVALYGVMIWYAIKVQASPTNLLLRFTGEVRAALKQQRELVATKILVDQATTNDDNNANCPDDEDSDHSRKHLDSRDEDAFLQQ